MNFVELLLIHENIIMNIRPDRKFAKWLIEAL